MDYILIELFQKKLIITFLQSKLKTAFYFLLKLKITDNAVYAVEFTVSNRYVYIPLYSVYNTALRLYNRQKSTRAYRAKLNTAIGVDKFNRTTAYDCNGQSVMPQKITAVIEQNKALVCTLHAHPYPPQPRACGQYESGNEKYRIREGINEKTDHAVCKHRYRAV